LEWWYNTVKIDGFDNTLSLAYTVHESSIRGEKVKHGYEQSSPDDRKDPGKDHHRIYPQKVILFGSYAYGHPDGESDLDLLIIKDTDKRPIERWVELKRLLRDRNRMTSVSPLVYTPGELERLALKGFFIQEVLEKGKVLYG